MYSRFTIRHLIQCWLDLRIIWLCLSILLQSTLVWGSCRTRCSEYTQEEYMNKTLYKYGINHHEEDLSSIEALKLYVRYSYLACAVPQGAIAMFNQSKSSRCLRVTRKRCELNCRRLLRPKKVKLNSNRTSPWSFEKTPYAHHSSSQTESTSSKVGLKKPEWHCLCYFEKYKGQFRRSTACRKTAKACWRLYGKIQAGTPILMKGSQYMGCSIVTSEHPSAATNSSKRYWKQSKRSGSYWSPKGCFLDQSLKSSKGEAIPYRKN